MSASTDDPNSDELDPDEPRTPLWMPVLGLALFLLGLGYALATSDEPEAAGGADTAADEAAAEGAGGAPTAE